MSTMLNIPAHPVPVAPSVVCQPAAQAGAWTPGPQGAPRLVWNQPAAAPGGPPALGAAPTVNWSSQAAATPVNWPAPVAVPVTLVAFQAPPPPTAPSVPISPSVTPPPGPVPETSYYVAINGQVTEMTRNQVWQLVNAGFTGSVMSKDQTSGWKTAVDFGMVAVAPVAPPPAAPSAPPTPPVVQTQPAVPSVPPVVAPSPLPPLPHDLSVAPVGVAPHAGAQQEVNGNQADPQAFITKEHVVELPDSMSITKMDTKSPAFPAATAGTTMVAAASAVVDAPRTKPPGSKRIKADQHTRRTKKNSRRPNKVHLAPEMKSQDKPAQPVVLSAKAVAFLAQREGIIDSGKVATISMAVALYEVHAYDGEDLHSGRFKSTADYARHRFGFGKAYVSQLLHAGALVEELGKKFAMANKLPRNERQIRPLMRLPKEERASLWEVIVANVDSEAVTGKIVAEKVRQRGALLGLDWATKITPAAPSVNYPPAPTVTGTASESSNPPNPEVKGHHEEIQVRLNPTVPATQSVVTAFATTPPTELPANSAVSLNESTLAARHRQKRECEKGIRLAIQQFERAIAPHPDADQFAYYVKKFYDTYAWATRTEVDSVTPTA
jgi:hypothetical protein